MDDQGKAERFVGALFCAWPATRLGEVLKIIPGQFLTGRDRKVLCVWLTYVSYHELTLAGRGGAWIAGTGRTRTWSRLPSRASSGRSTSWSRGHCRSCTTSSGGRCPPRRTSTTWCRRRCCAAWRTWGTCAIRPGSGRGWLRSPSTGSAIGTAAGGITRRSHGDDLDDPSADFADLTILRLELTSQRREIAKATRWLDPDDRELLALWWLEAAGTLTREEVATAAGLARGHAAVRIQRMKAQLDSARAVVHALDATPPCSDLMLLATDWPGRPDPLWRKRFVRHTRECARCAPAHESLVAAERLLAGLTLVPLPSGLDSLAAWLGSGAATASHATAGHAVGSASGILNRFAEAVGVKVLAGVTVVTVGAAAVTVYAALPDRDEPPVAAAFVTPTAAAPPTSDAPTPPAGTATHPRRPRHTPRPRRA